MEELRKLNEEYYVKLSLQEKLDVLGVVLQIEMKHLGIDGEIRLVSKSLSDSIAGYYSDTDKMIVLNDSIIDNVDEAILTVLHEVYHAMQYAVVDSLDKLDLSDDACELHYFRTVCEWQYDMEHYVGEENIAGWYSQEMEQDSISYSKERIESYLNYIYSLSNQE